ncbi:ribonuclease P protein component [Dyella caseinilytica]|uniref:Ribonuclease P protein component n=1 Tax=Dyella caseinilytica TaxID=1849581 RepID=A0ABX7GTI8_9GAMM|nr:ribonuclease P protein component [Dyella caseinilytica]QRN53752.1 ribonuclease P protein component [Dyella caseinilytica]GFZ88881.1 ribonuclease P protein component [Dyella caseinilytica]
MDTAGLPRKARIRRAGDFAVLRQASGRLGGRCFSVRYRSNELGYARLGLAVSKRVSKRAVERNRVKRLLRESFRRVRSQLPALDLMVMAREQAAGVPGPELLAELDALWRRLPPLKRAGDAATIAC